MLSSKVVLLPLLGLFLMECIRQRYRPSQEEPYLVQNSLPISEGQYRRNWSFAPALWNLYFRERINLGASLRVQDSVQPGGVAKVMDTDIAEAAVGLYKKLESGTRAGPQSY